MTTGHVVIGYIQFLGVAGRAQRAMPMDSLMPVAGGSGRSGPVPSSLPTAPATRGPARFAADDPSLSRATARSAKRHSGRCRAPTRRSGPGALVPCAVQGPRAALDVGQRVRGAAGGGGQARVPWAGPGHRALPHWDMMRMDDAEGTALGRCQGASQACDRVRD